MLMQSLGQSQLGCSSSSICCLYLMSQGSGTACTSPPLPPLANLIIMLTNRHGQVLNGLLFNAKCRLNPWAGATPPLPPHIV